MKFWVNFIVELKYAFAFEIKETMIGATRARVLAYFFPQFSSVCCQIDSSVTFLWNKIFMSCSVVLILAPGL